MAELMTVISLTVASFVSTSLDNLFLLTGFHAHPHYRSRDVLGGYVGTIAGVIVVALALGTVAEQAPAMYLGYLGIIPLTLGLVGLYRMRRGPGGGEARRPRGSAGIGSVVLVMGGNSGDTLGVFASLFADTGNQWSGAILGTAVSLAVAWSALARWLLSHGRAMAPLQRYGPYLLPFLLIAVGLYVLMDTSTDTIIH